MEQRETYEAFFKRMQGLTDEIVQDPTSIQLDAFAKLHRKGLPVPERSAMNMVVEEHAVIALSPYEVDEYSKPKSKPVQSQQIVSRTTKKTLKRGISEANSSGVTKNADKARNAPNRKVKITQKRDSKFDSKSEVSTNSRKLNQQETQSNPKHQAGNTSSHRTMGSSNAQGNAFSTGVKFEDDNY